LNVEAAKSENAMTNLRRAAGELLVVGLGGTELTALERAWLKLVRPAGIILFRRNISGAHQTRAFLKEASTFAVPNCLRCVDLEGGTVDRLRDALAPLPSAQAVERADASRASSLHRRKLQKSFAFEHGSLVAQAVRAFGFNTTLAPVLDLGLPDSVKVMGTRAPAPTPDGVTNYARGFLSGLAAHGVVGCAKHFPGLGGGTLDSHMDTPAILRNNKEIWQQDLVPYRDLHAQLQMVMVNHAAYRASPSKTQPASVSHYWITRVLRHRIGYKGIIFSDDLEMGGILKFLPIEEAVVACVRAGMDLMEICHSPELILRAHEALIAESEKSRTFAALVAARARRNAILRARLFSSPIPPQLSPDRFGALRARIQKFSGTVANSQPAREAQPA
jgi:beta-N-acetylhexosaminidase